MKNTHKSFRQFFLCGMIVLSVMLVGKVTISGAQNLFGSQSAGNQGIFQAAAEAVNSSGSSFFIKEKKLPIYCVDTDSPKVALSFDAAWGESWLLEVIAKLSIPPSFHPVNALECKLAYKVTLSAQK